MLATVCVALVAALAPVAVAVRWADALATDTDSYLAAVGPLATQEEIQQAVAARVTAAVLDQIDVGELLGEVAAAIAPDRPRVQGALGLLEAPLEEAMTGYVHRVVDQVVTSERFAGLWTESNRVAHRAWLAAATGVDTELLQLEQDGWIVLDLAPVLDEARARLVERGLPLAPEPRRERDATFPLVQAPSLPEIRRAVGLLDALAVALPWVVLGLAAAAVVVAHRRRRTVATLGATVAASFVLFLVVVAVARGMYLGGVPASPGATGAWAVVFDDVTWPVRRALRWGAVAGAAVVLVAYLAGPNPLRRALAARSQRAP